VTSESIVGIWRLVSYENRAAGTRVRTPFGRHPVGYLIYTADGWMSAAVMPESRGQPAPSGDDVTDPLRPRLSWRRVWHTARRVLAATRYISYSGRYTVEGNTVVHHVEVSQMPGIIGSDQERTMELRAGFLVLTAETGDTNQQFVWERVAQEAAHGSLPRQQRTG
jgi:hypothetical protein